MQVDPIKPKMKLPGTKRWKQKCDEPLSKCAFKFKLRRYAKVATEAIPRVVGRSVGEAAPHAVGATRGTTLATLIDAGLIAPGAGVITTLYNGVEAVADLLPDGSIEWEGRAPFASVSAFSLAMKRSVNPGRKADDGWKSVRYDGVMLDVYKQQHNAAEDGGGGGGDGGGGGGGRGGGGGGGGGAGGGEGGEGGGQSVWEGGGVSGGGGGCGGGGGFGGMAAAAAAEAAEAKAAAAKSAAKARAAAARAVKAGAYTRSLFESA